VISETHGVNQTPSTGLQHPSLEEGTEVENKAMLGVWELISAS